MTTTEKVLLIIVLVLAFIAMCYKIYWVVENNIPIVFVI